MIIILITVVMATILQDWRHCPEAAGEGGEAGGDVARQAVSAVYNHINKYYIII